VEALADLLNGATRVTLLCGGGTAGAHDEVVKLAGLLKAPVVHALRGKEHIEYDNPYSVGMTGLIGFSSGYYAMGACDVLLMLGTDFPIASSTRRARKSPRWTCAPKCWAAAPIWTLACWAKWPTLEALLPLIADKAGTRICKPALPITARRARGWTSWPPASPAGGSTRSIWCAC
jgi:pyruvate dehydrogenase (quinone)